MKKYIVWAESEKQLGMWFLVDAATEEQARRVLLAEEKNITEIRGCQEVKPGKEPGVTHKFIDEEYI